MLARLAHVVSRHRRLVIGVWIVLTLFGVYAGSQVSKRWYQSFSIPGKPAYEANQRTLEKFGTGIRPPIVVVFHTDGDATAGANAEAIRAAMGRAEKAVPPQQLGTSGGVRVLHPRSSSYFTTNDNPMYVSNDKHTTFLLIYPP